MKITQEEFQKRYGASPQAFQVAPQRSGTQKVGDFLGVSAFGEGLGTAAALTGSAGRGAAESRDTLRSQADKLMAAAQKYTPSDPRRAKLLREAQAAYGTGSTEAQQIASMGPTNKEFIAGAMNTFANIAGAGSYGRAVQGARAGKIASTIAKPTVKALAGQAAAQAGTMSGANALAENKSVKEILQSAVGGAALGALTVGGLAVGGKVLRAANKGIAEALPKYWYKASTGLPRDLDPTTLLKQKGEQKLVGGYKQLLERAAKVLDGAEKKITTHPDVQKTVNLNKVLQDEGFQGFINELAQYDQVGYGEAQKVVNRFLGSGPKNMKQMTIKDLLGLRRKIAEQLSKAMQRQGAESPSIVVQTRQALVEAIRGTIRKESPAIGKILRQEESPIMALIKSLKKFSQGTTEQVALSPTAAAQAGTQSRPIGTRIARSMWTMGKPGRAFEGVAGKTETGIPQDLRRILRSLTTTAATNEQ